MEENRAVGIAAQRVQKASVPLHDEAARGAPLLAPLLAPLNFIERETSDDRNLVKKDLSRAQRGVGLRKSAKLGKAACASVKRSRASTSTTAREIGRDAQRDFSKHDAKA